MKFNRYVIPRMTTLACEYERISVCSRPWFDEYMLAILVLASSTGQESNTAGLCRHLGITLCFDNNSLSSVQNIQVFHLDYLLFNKK